MEIKVLGTGCSKCNKLESLVKEVLSELDIETGVEKVTNYMDIARAGVMITPALIIDGEVKVSGSVPSREELKKMIQGRNS